MDEYTIAIALIHLFLQFIHTYFTFKKFVVLNF